MNQIVPNLLKALGVILVSALVIWVFLPQKQAKDEALNSALEFLGTKLLAMAPQDQENEVQQEFEKIREQALAGNVNDEHLEEFAAIVLNAEAEGRSWDQKKIDSALVVLQQVERRHKSDERRLQRLANRIAAYREFQVRMKTIVPDSSFEHRRRSHPRTFYRITPEFVIQVDTAAIAQAMAMHTHHFADSIARRFSRRPPPPPPRVDVLVGELSKELQQLHFEWRYHELPPDFADSLEVFPELADSLGIHVAPIVPPPPAHPRPRRKEGRPN